MLRTLTRVNNRKKKKKDITNRNKSCNWELSIKIFSNPLSLSQSFFCNSTSREIVVLISATTILIAFSKVAGKRKEYVHLHNKQEQQSSAFGIKPSPYHGMLWKQSKFITSTRSNQSRTCHVDQILDFLFRSIKKLILEQAYLHMPCMKEIKCAIYVYYASIWSRPLKRR